MALSTSLGRRALRTPHSERRASEILMQQEKRKDEANERKRAVQLHRIRTTPLAPPHLQSAAEDSYDDSNNPRGSLPAQSSPADSTLDQNNKLVVTGPYKCKRPKRSIRFLSQDLEDDDLESAPAALTEHERQENGERIAKVMSMFMCIFVVVGFALLFVWWWVAVSMRGWEATMCGSGNEMWCGL